MTYNKQAALDTIETRIVAAERPLHRSVLGSSSADTQWIAGIYEDGVLVDMIGTWQTLESLALEGRFVDQNIELHLWGKDSSYYPDELAERAQYLTRDYMDCWC